MRTLFLSLAAAGLSLLGTALTASDARAQFYNPYLAGYAPGVYSPPAFYNYRYYYSPYGLRTYSQYATAPDAFGNYYYWNWYNNYGRPYSAGPYHAVYWDPYLGRYVYVYR